MESRRREILGVAAELFAEHGYEGTSLEKIAAGSGYSVGGIYNFFPSKDAVYAAVLDRHAAALVERLAACADAPGSGMDKLLAMASTAVRTLHEFPDHARFTISSLAPERSPTGRGNFRMILEAYASAIDEGQRDGTVRAGEPRDLAQYVGGLVLAQTHVDIPLDTFLDVARKALQA
ncbi:transcriptional regulator, TetR family [Cryptosporangium aurantiacum]|uniref:Transcriptional regulator, TetR family n=2 Tax=Cryptosporangium aurantiacum TaxID=134849 RepID=A0A1M7RAB3_9ACTN|nr:transcriptional regulator, TetR family [Cryptosporangium aurantiacum]